MAPDITNPEVLKRELIVLEDRLLSLAAPISLIQKPKATTSFDVESKLNEVIDTVNAISTALNATRKNNF